MLAGAGWAAVGNMNGQLDPEAEQVRAKLDTEPGMETQPGNQVEYTLADVAKILGLFMCSCSCQTLRTLLMLLLCSRS